MLKVILASLLISFNLQSIICKLSNLRVLMTDQHSTCILRYVTCIVFLSECVHQMNCEVVLISNVSDTAQFTLIGKVNGPSWLAMDLSYHQHAGRGNFITECWLNADGSVRFNQMWNSPDSQIEADVLTTDHSWVSNPIAQYDGDLLICKWVNKGGLDKKDPFAKS